MLFYYCYSLYLFQDSWLYHLTVAAGGGTGNVGTHYEQLIAKLMECDGDHSEYSYTLSSVHRAPDKSKN